MMAIGSKGYFVMQIPRPIQSSSLMIAMFNSLRYYRLCPFVRLDIIVCTVDDISFSAWHLFGFTMAIREFSGHSSFSNLDHEDGFWRMGYLPVDAGRFFWVVVVFVCFSDAGFFSGLKTNWGGKWADEWNRGEERRSVKESVSDYYRTQCDHRGFECPNQGGAQRRM